MRRATRRAMAGVGRPGHRAARGARCGSRRSGQARRARGAWRRQPRRHAGPTRRAAPPRGPGPRSPRQPRARGRAARRSYSAIAIANGSAIPPASRRGSGERYRSTTSAASGRPLRSTPLTPNRRRIARSWPTLVAFDALAPHAAASARVRVTSASRCSGSPIGCMAAVWRASVAAEGRHSGDRPGPEWWWAGQAGSAGSVFAAASGPVRAVCPIHTTPSSNRSAFQIGARAFVSSIA